MNNLKKFLQSARRLEARQTARKAFDVEDNERFDAQRERYQDYQMKQHLEFEDEFAHEMSLSVAPAFEMEQASLTQQAEALGRLTAFERQCGEIQQDAPDSAFARIASVQHPDLDRHPPETLKQLQSAPAEDDVIDLHVLAETHLKNESTRNKRAIQRGPTGSDDEELFKEQDEEKHSVFYFRPIPSKEK